MRWFHYECVNVDQFNTPSAWFCDQCRILKQLNLQEVTPVISFILILEEKDPLLSKRPEELVEISNDITMELNMDGDFASIKTENINDELLDLIVDTEESSKQVVDKKYQTAVIRQLVLNFLTERSKTDNSAIYAKQFIITRWHYEDGEDDTNHSYYETQWDMDPKTVSKGKFLIVLF